MGMDCRSVAPRRRSRNGPLTVSKHGFSHGRQWAPLEGATGQVSMTVDRLTSAFSNPPGLTQVRARAPLSAARRCHDMAAWCLVRASESRRRSDPRCQRVAPVSPEAMRCHRSSGEGGGRLRDHLGRSILARDSRRHGVAQTSAFGRQRERARTSACLFPSGCK
jgi:hypothetical protein